jgi:hypothetical protein
MKIAISGSRDIDDDGVRRIEETVPKIIDHHDPKAVLFGGAKGTDTISLRAIYDNFSETDRPVLKAIVPFKLDDQPKRSVQAIEKYCDEITEMDSPKSKGAYFERNQKLVNQSDKLIACWNGSSKGTAHTIQEAKNKGLDVIVLLTDPPPEKVKDVWETLHGTSIWIDGKPKDFEEIRDNMEAFDSE